MLAPKSRADLTFIMHSLSWLAANGTAAIVCFPGIMYRGGTEKKIRKYLVDNNYVDCIIQLPANYNASINRSSIYRDPPKEKAISDDDLFIMRRIDEIHTAHPTWGYRTITKIIRRDDEILVNRKKIRRMMRVMGIYTIYSRANLSKSYHAQYIRPCLLRNLSIVRPDQVWGVISPVSECKKDSCIYHN